LFWKDGICMTPTDTRKRDELAEAFERELESADGYAFADAYSFKAGYDAGLAECAGEIERLKVELQELRSIPAFELIDRWREQAEALAKALEYVCQVQETIHGKPNVNSIWMIANKALAAWEASQKRGGE
jgi:hypothetical protein